MVDSIIYIGGGVRAHIFRYHLQKMETVFPSGEITFFRHLVDADPMYIPLETKAPITGIFAWKMISK